VKQNQDNSKTVDENRTGALADLRRNRPPHVRVIYPLRGNWEQLLKRRHISFLPLRFRG